MLAPGILLCLLASFRDVQANLLNDTLGWENGYTSLATANIDLLLVEDSQTLASLRVRGSSFDFLPFDMIKLRSADGQRHIGDLTYRYRMLGETSWTNGDSATTRKPVTALKSAGLAAADLTATLPVGKLIVKREWTELDGDVALTFTLTNNGTSTMEIGSLGFPMEFNSIFTNRDADNIQANGSLHDPYIGLDAGYIRVTPTSGNGPALVVTPLGDTPLQAWRNLYEASLEGTYYGSQTFEGFYEWQTLSRAFAENEWSGVEPWNDATSKYIASGSSLSFGLRFTVATEGVRGIQNAVRSTGTPFAVGIPGHVVPSDLTAQLFLFADQEVSTIVSYPEGSFTISELGSKVYSLKPNDGAWGRVRVTISYSDGKLQTVHYYVTKAGSTVLSDLGNFATTTSWFNDTSDPFGRAPCPLTYDREANTLVKQENRAWIAGISDEAGAGTYIAATIKQAAQPNAVEIAKLELFVDEVLFKTVQTSDYAVRKSAFFYDPTVLPDYPYNSSINWSGWASWDKENAYLTDRAYDYIHPLAAYWGLYRAGRAYPDLLSVHTWDWYLNQAYRTITALMKLDQYGNCCEVGYALVGLMEETIIGELLKDLRREGYALEASNVEANMSVRADFWETLSVPFGSEMAWDSTGQEGVYYWSKYFGHTGTMTKALNSILGYMPTVAHWGWNGNARRYWDNLYGGKVERIERQIHHYGSGLNALPVLSQLRSDPTDSYLARVGYAGMNGPLTNVDQEGFGAASFHSWPNTLAWDGYSGDYGPNHLGLILGSGTYVVEDTDVGLVAYGGELVSGHVVKVTTKDAVRRRIFIGPLGLFVEIDAGIIDSFEFSPTTKAVSLNLSQLLDVPKATSAILWLETTSGNINYTVSEPETFLERQGWKIPLSSPTIKVEIVPF